MTAAAKSVCYFGFYLYVTGLTLIFAPNLLLKTLQIPETKEVWIRILGVLVFCVGYYCHRAGAENIPAVFKHTIPTRALVFISFSAFVALGYAPAVLIVFGVIDLIGAVWTWMALKKAN
jgi:hypothetical protein